MEKKINRFIFLLLAVVLVCGLVTYAETKQTVNASGSNFVAENAAAATTYHSYLERHTHMRSPDEVLIIEGEAYSRAEGMTPLIEQNYHGTPGAVITGEEGSIEWIVDVREAGLYNIAVKYFPMSGKSSAIERDIYINGELPYKELRSVLFQRIWTNKGEIVKDQSGNEYRPNQVEQPVWREITVTGSSYKTNTSLQVYLKKGLNTVQFVSIKEPMAIDYVKFFKQAVTISYDEFKREYQGKEYSKNRVGTITIQGEKASLKSDPVIYPINDRTSPNTQPYHVSKIKLNTIGGYNWRYPKQWISWDVDVEKEGLYQISMRVKQNYTSGGYSSRKLLIDGVVPFKEVENISFEYKEGWYMKTLGNEKEIYQFHLTKGKHTIMLENSVGEIGNILETADSTVMELNNIYRKILMITGAIPDANRDYRLEKNLPECMEVFVKEVDHIGKMKNELYKLTKTKGANYSTLDKLEVQLQDFVRDPDSIPERLDQFRINISNMSAWILSSCEQPLLMDYILLSPEDKKLPQAEAGFFKKLWHEVRAFFISFFEDYSVISEQKSGGKTVTLWLGALGGQQGSGRDQAQILKSLIDNYFTAETGIKVNLKLVDMGMLLSAVATGNGPDIAIGQERSMPMNYAFRGALTDLKQFTDCEEVLKRFDEEASVAFKAQGKLYALPETYSFSMMFYRTDILNELKMNVPGTWDDVYNLIPVLHNNNLDIGLPSIVEDNLDLYLALLYQNGGKVYNRDSSETLLDSNEAVYSFKAWADFYTKYRVTQKMDHLTRFRTGEAPIVFMPYTFYNNLVAAAPEITGLWDFTLVPGTKKTNGSIARNVVGTGTGSVMFENARDKQAAWEFLKWWTNTDTQYKYGLEIESLQGPSGRWPTANNEALMKLPWTSKAIRQITEQKKFAVGLEEVPGGYMTTRYLGTAIRLVVNNGIPAREAILDWNKMIEDEIKIKRKEFGLE